MSSYYQAIEPAKLEWKDGTPVSKIFGDVYFSSTQSVTEGIKEGIQECRHVFLEKNNLEQRWQQLAKINTASGFTIIETGFGTGLNFLCAAQLWQKTRPNNSSQWLEFVSTEKHPLTHSDLGKSLQQFPELNGPAELLIKQYPPLTPGFHLIKLPSLKIKLLLLFGDIKDTLPQLTAKADAWFLDGFSPAKNQSMWSTDLFKQISRLSKPGTSFSTFTAAGVVKKGMRWAGFEVIKSDGFGRKRDMLCGTLNTTVESKHGQQTVEKKNPDQLNAADTPWFITPDNSATKNRTATIIGGGLAGTTTAYSLAQRGWQVTILERHAELAEEASGNPAGVLYTKINGERNPQTEFYTSSYLYALSFIQQMPRHLPSSRQVVWDNCGVLQLSSQEKINLAKTTKAKSDSANRFPNELWPESVVQAVSHEQAEKLCGFGLNKSTLQNFLFFPNAGWVCPPLLCRTLVKLSDNINIISNQEVASIEYRPVESGLAQSASHWLLKDSNKKTICSSDIVILANSLGGNQFNQTNYLPLHSVRGQVSSVPENENSMALKTVLCHEGYTLPAINRRHCIGATFQPRDKQPEVRMEDNLSNFEKLKHAVPDLYQSLGGDKLDKKNFQGRTAFRCQSPDYLPVVGPVPDKDFFMAMYKGLNQGQTKTIYPRGKYHSGLYVNLAHGSRGLTSTPLAAEVIASYANNETQALPKHILDALNPARFLIRGLKKGR